MKIASLSPWTVTLFLRDVADAARSLDRGRIGDWSAVASLCDRWQFCESKFDRFFLGRRAAIASRRYAALGGAYCARIAAYYRVVALAAFAGARGSRV